MFFMLTATAGTVIPPGAGLVKLSNTLDFGAYTKLIGIPLVGVCSVLVLSYLLITILPKAATNCSKMVCNSKLKV